MKEYVIKLGAEVTFDADSDNPTANIIPIASWGGITQIISAYGSNISIVKVDYEVKQTAGSVAVLPYPAVYANFGELEDSIPLKNGVAYTPETKFEKTQFNLKINTVDVDADQGLNVWEVKATIRILIGDGKYEQFATDASLRALEAISRLQLQAAGGRPIQHTFGLRYPSHRSQSASSLNFISPHTAIPAEADYALVEFENFTPTNSLGYMNIGESAEILAVNISDKNGNDLGAESLVWDNILLSEDGTEVIQRAIKVNSKVTIRIEVEDLVRNGGLNIVQFAAKPFKLRQPLGQITQQYWFASVTVRYYTERV